MYFHSSHKPNITKIHTQENLQQQHEFVAVVNTISQQIFYVNEIHVEASTKGHCGDTSGAKVTLRVIPNMPEFEAELVNTTQDAPVHCQVLA